MKLEETTLDDIKTLLNEVDEAKEFISTKGSDSTMYEVLQTFSSDKDFHVFTFKDGEDVIGFTSTFPNKYRCYICYPSI